MATGWYIFRGEIECGPFSGHQLRELALAGKISGNDGIRKGTEGAVVVATRVKGLFAADANAAQRMRFRASAAPSDPSPVPTAHAGSSNEPLLHSSHSHAEISEDKDCTPSDAGSLAPVGQQWASLVHRLLAFLRSCWERAKRSIGDQTSKRIVPRLKATWRKCCATATTTKELIKAEIKKGNVLTPNRCVIGASAFVVLLLVVLSLLQITHMLGLSDGDSQVAGNAGRVDDVADDNRTILMLERPSRSIDAKYGDLMLKLSANGEYLLVNGNQLWQIGAEGEESSSPLPQRLHELGLKNLALSRDGRLLAGVNIDEATLVLLKVDGGQLQQTDAITIRGKLGEDLNNAAHPLRASGTIANWYSETLWSPDSSFVIARYNWSIQIIATHPTPSLVAEFSSPLNSTDRNLHDIAYNGVAISPDGELVAVKFETRPPTVSVINRHGTLVKTLEFSGEREGDLFLHGFSDDSKLFFANTGKEGVTIWDTTDMEKVASIGAKQVFRWYDSDREVVVVSDPAGVHFQEWNLPDKSFGRKWVERLSRSDMYGSYSPDGHMGVYGWDDGLLEVWDLEQNAILGVLGQVDGNRRHNMVISADRSTVATNPTGTSTVEVWRWADGRKEKFSEYAVTRRGTGTSSDADSEWVEINGSMVSAKGLPEYYRKKAPPVTRKQYDALVKGVLPQDVWEFLGGRPVKEGSDMSKEDVIVGSSVFEGIDWKYARYEVYQGNGGPESRVVLLYYGDTVPPPLHSMHATGLK